MLDTLTKRRIDDCRDILVGKLPDPKAQIEQITIGLIYKFMADMDKEAIDLGGKAKFFSDYTITDPKDENKEITIPFSKYSWEKLFDARVTAAEMLRLYSEAIESMEKNPNIPQLFRDIFNNAYLPYRDPETLKMFLKTIGEFEYSHSEKLGDAFEYLLSVMGSQGDAGQFRTPRHIIDFLVAIVDPGKTDTIMDPACGTAGFLISAFKYIKEKNKNELTPDQSKKLIQNFVGYDISPDMVRLSLVNLYLHGFPEPHIFEYDTLSSEERWNENFDVILANPPFMSPKGGIRPHKKFTISSKRSEVLFVDYIAEHLNPKGRAGIIVPEGVIFQSGTAYKELRKMLVDNHLYAVVSLPSGVFNPYSGVKTSILLLDSALAKKSNEVLFIKINNDGYSLGSQRGEVKGGQLEEAISTAKAFKNSILEGTEFKNTFIAHSVAKTEIAKNGDYNFTGDRYKVVESVKSDFPFVQLPEVCEINPSTIDPSSLGSDRFHYIDISSIENGTGKVFYNNLINVIDAPSRARRHIQDKDVLLSTVRPNLKAFGYIEKPKLNSIASTGFAVLRAKNNLDPKFLLYNLFNDGIVNQMISMMGKGAYPSINQSDVSSLKIPLPPLPVQKEIVAEIEGYQKIIDGAKMVVENYKPKIEIDPEWEMVELGSVCEVNPKKSEIKDLDDNLEISFVPMADLKENQIDFSPTQTKQLSEVYKGYTYFRENDVLLAKVTPCFENGKAGIAKGLQNGIGFGSSEYFVFRPNNKILSTWIYLNIITSTFRNGGKLNMTGTGGLQRVPSAFVKSTLIPLPEIRIQNKIVAKIENEQNLVTANRKLIEIFEQKIKDRIAKVWGE